MNISKKISSVPYRVGQFIAALQACLPAWAGGLQEQLSAAEEKFVKSVLLTAPQQKLFVRMPPNDRRHAIAVANALKQQGKVAPALMQAALLHDVGKSIGQPIIHRVLIVLLEAFWPQALTRLSSLSDTDVPGANRSCHFDTLLVGHWRRPFVVHAQHSRIGALWAEEVGADPLVVRLIARHHDKLKDRSTEENILLDFLQTADGSN